MSTTTELFTLATQHQRAGNLAHAQTLCRELLLTDPSHAEGWCLLALCFQAQGDFENGQVAWKRALALNPNHVEAHTQLAHLCIQQNKIDEAIGHYRHALRLNAEIFPAQYMLGVALHEKGHLDEALVHLRQAAQLNPGHADTHHRLGIALLDRGDLEEAAKSFRETLQLDSSIAGAWNNLGVVSHQLGKLNDAVQCLQNAIRLQPLPAPQQPSQWRPEFAETHRNLANVLFLQGNIEQALVHFRHAVTWNPQSAQAHCDLGRALRRQGQLAEAVAALRLALHLQPEAAEAHFLLGLTQVDQKETRLAADSFARAVHLNPAYAEAQHNLAQMLKIQGNYADATAHFKLAAWHQPAFADAHYGLGNVLLHLGQWEDAVVHLQNAVRINPNLAEAQLDLAAALIRQDQLQEAITCCRRAVQLKPDLPGAHSSLISCLNLSPEIDADALFAEHRQWGLRNATTHNHHTNDPSPDRRLRIGYVSPDLRMHALARYIEPVLACHDKRQVEVFCYAEDRVPDAGTQRIRQFADQWCPTCDLTDGQLSQQIVKDRIDILVDLAGHTAGNRLPVFAHKPAPIQTTWLGYLNTTGLDAVDYRLTDDVLDPVGQPIRDTEELLRLPSGFCCFGTPGESPDIGPLPAKRYGHVTFGSLNNLSKINSQVFDLWSEVLRAVPTARLLIFRHTMTGQVQERFHQEFTKRGIDGERLDLRNECDKTAFLSVYQEIDISLDTFPVTGGVTTCESLWMGVPVVSLAGVRPASRNSASLLTHAGLADWVVHSREQYVKLAVQAANDLEKLALLRSRLRDMMAASLCDAPRFTRELESAYRRIWRRWCENQTTFSHGALARQD